MKSTMTNGSDTGNTQDNVSSSNYREETLDFDEDLDVSLDNSQQSISDVTGVDRNSVKEENEESDVESVDDEEDDDEDDDDGSSTDDDEEEEENGSQISDSEPTCYICLNAFEGQDIGAPESCENIHEFCFECIEEWSKVCYYRFLLLLIEKINLFLFFFPQRVNTCPIDRREFDFILLRKQSGGETISRVNFSLSTFFRPYVKHFFELGSSGF